MGLLRQAHGRSPAPSFYAQPALPEVTQFYKALGEHPLKADRGT